MNSAGEVTATMQDYLKVMLSLSESVHEIRVTDIAAKLNIAKATVAQEINHLKKHGLVLQEKYGTVQLTASGKEIAEEIRWKHHKLRQFLVNVLEVNPRIAEKDACLMEHVVSRHTMNRLIAYLEAHSTIAEGDKKSFVQSEINDKKETNEVKLKSVRALNELKIGEKGRVLRIAMEEGLRKRVLEMGVTPGSEIQMKGQAPTGDPVEINIKGYQLALRKSEAAQIFVEIGA